MALLYGRDRVQLLAVTGQIDVRTADISVQEDDKLSVIGGRRQDRTGQDLPQHDPKHSIAESFGLGTDDCGPTQDLLSKLMVTQSINQSRNAQFLRNHHHSLLCLRKPSKGKLF
jgi:hypothetical protein